MKKRTVTVASCVGGGPMARLVARLSDDEVAAAVLEHFSPADWRTRMNGGRARRLGTRLQSLLAFPLRTVLAAVLDDIEVLVPTTNPFVLPLACVATRVLHGRTVIPLMYDLYPDALEAVGLARPGSLFSRAAAALNRYCFAHADGVVFIGRRMAEHAIERYGAPRRWTVLETGADPQEFAPARLGSPEPESELEAWCDEHFVVAYVGALGHMHDWDTLRDAARRILADGAPARVGFVIAASGPGVAYLREAWADLPADRVRFVEPLGDRAWARLLARADVTLATLKPAAHKTSMPSKALSSLAAGAPLVAVAPRDSDLAHLIEDHQAGVVIEPGDAERLAQVLTDLAADEPRRRALSDRARRAALERYDLALLAEDWRRFIRQVRRERSKERKPSLLKRAFDVAASGAGLLATAPVMAGTALAIRATMGSPVLFRQPRPGLGGKPFDVLKFRTMRHPRPGEESPDADAARLTRLGRLLRATSLDELPTLLSVLRGDMSLVGPRPLLIRYLERYDEEQARRHDVPPGVTGWAQVHGRNAISWEEKFRHDIWYVDNWTFWRDLQILVLTVFKVLGAADISQEGHATMPEFMGTGEAPPESGRRPHVVAADGAAPEVARRA